MFLCINLFNKLSQNLFLWRVHFVLENKKFFLYLPQTTNIMKNNYRFFKTLLVLITTIGVSLAIQMLFAGEAAARPGGGHGFHGGGGSHGGGGGGSFVFIPITGDFRFDLVINLIFWGIILWISHKSQGNGDDSVSSVATVENLKWEKQSLQNKIDKLSKNDPNFSKPIFLDYATMMFNSFYLSHCKENAEDVKPFFMGDIPDYGRNYFSEIAIGTADISEIEINDFSTNIVVYFNANYTVTNIDTGHSYRARVEEDWYFVRKKGIQSREPQGFGVIRCSHCGSALEFKDSGTCSSCGSRISFESGQWMVGRVLRKRIERTAASDMLTYEDELGTSLPTIYSPTLTNSLVKFLEFHKDVYASASDFEKKVAIPYFTEIYKHWSNNTWTQARHLLSERQWNNFNEYLHQLVSYGYTNRLDDLKITNVQTVNYEFDKNYEMITVRIFAECRDYIVDSDGNVKAGNNRTPRQFSEYWTFVASRKATFKDNKLSECPSCGAPVDRMGEAGVCEYCGNKITDGCFSWVLFSITQDEVYSG